jgi:glucosamine--fructose-6-phosphate aminotransferase (isomerizing)
MCVGVVAGATGSDRVAAGGPAWLVPGPQPIIAAMTEPPVAPSPVPFNPDRPLPGPPEPWHWAETPVDRGGPPFFMTEMIAAEPAFAQRCLARLAADGSAARLAGELRVAAANGAPVVVVGCGTSEHGALGVAEILGDAWRRAGLPGPGPVSVQAFEASLEPQAGGLCIAISHDGGTWATMRAVAAARATGARTSLITVSGRAPAAAGIDIVVETAERDQSYCHTIGYLSPLVAAAAVGAALTGEPIDGAAVRAVLGAGIAAAGGAVVDERADGAAARIAAALEDARTILVVGSGSDRPAARELVLKIEEGSWIPAAMRDLETFLHGHLPSTDGSTGLIVILTERRARAERIARTRRALEAAAVIGIQSAAILAEGVAAELPTELTRAGRIVVPEAPTLPSPVAALLSSATPLQLVAERLARARGTNPDPIRRDDPVYAGAAATAEA